MFKLNPVERKKFWKEFDRDSLIAAVLKIIIQLSFPVIMFVFWDKGIIRLLAFIISWIAWHKFWGDFITKILKEKWEWVSTEEVDFVNKKKK
jgi:hypothetical protein